MSVFCLVTDRHRLAAAWHATDAFDAVVRQVRWAAASGIDLVQVRERDLSGAALEQLVARCVQAAQGTRTRVLVNDRADVAVAAGADGVHVPASGLDAARLRGLLPPAFVIGRSVHSAEEAAAAEARGGLDYVILGTVFPTVSKPGLDRPAGIDELVRAAAACRRLPVLAIGGVTMRTIAAVAAAGAAGIAAIGLFSGPDEGESAWRQQVEEARRLFDTSRPDSLRSDSPAAGRLRALADRSSG